MYLLLSCYCDIMTDVQTLINIMTDDNYIKTSDSIDINTDDIYIDEIMTDDIQMRAIGKPKVEKDPNALKLASFRTKEGIWAEFCQKAESINLTATDVLKAAMDQFINGEYDPRIYVPSRQHHDGISRNDAVDIVNSAIADTLAKLEPSNEAVLTVINTLSLPSNDDVSTAINTAIDRVNDRLAELEAEVERLKSETRTVETSADVNATRETAPAKTTDKDPNVKSWAAFFGMIGMKALKATDAQKEPNVDTRTQQIEQGLKAAKEQGLGEWAIKRAGRDFVRVGE